MLDTSLSIEAFPANWGGYSLRNYTPILKMSEETMAYTADLLYEGALVGTISNRGRGGASLVRGQDARLHEERVVDAPSGARYPGTDLIASTDSVLEAIAQTGKMLATSRLRAHLVVLAKEREYLGLLEVVFAGTLDVHSIPLEDTRGATVLSTVRRYMAEIDAAVACFSVGSTLYVGRLVQMDP